MAATSDEEIKRQFLEGLKVLGWRVNEPDDIIAVPKVPVDAFISHPDLDIILTLHVVLYDGNKASVKGAISVRDVIDGNEVPYLVGFLSRQDYASAAPPLMDWQLFAGERAEILALRPPELAEGLAPYLGNDQATNKFPRETPETEDPSTFEQSILAALKASGWTVAPQTHGPDKGIDAEICRNDLLLGRRLWLVAKQNRVKSGGKRSQVWQNLCNQYGRDVLIVQPIRRAEPPTTARSLEWLVVSREGQHRFISSLADLRKQLNERLTQRYAYAVTYAPDPDDKSRPWAGEAKSGSTITWTPEAQGRPHEMRPGDAVVFLRQNHSESPPQNADLVGTGYMLSADPKRGDTPSDPFPVRVLQFFEHEPITYAELSKAVYSNLWSSSQGITRISDEDAQEIDTYLSLRERNGLFELLSEDMAVESSSGEARNDDRADHPPHEADDISLHDDGAERDRDSLRRAPLAVAFARRLHEIWCQTQHSESAQKMKPWRNADSFVAHVDAPWGEGKSSFTNFVARTLNPQLDGRKAAPHFLKERYSDRADVSGMFIAAAHNLGRLRKPDQSYVVPIEGRRPWIIVHYNVWQHEDVVPPWWCFYQAIRESCFRTIRKYGVPEVRQGRDHKDRSLWRRVMRFCVIDRKHLPKDESKSTNYYYTEWEGWTVRIARWLYLWAHEIRWRIWNPDVRMRFYVAILTTLAVLVMIWTDVLDAISGKPEFNTATTIGLVAAILVTTGGFIWTAIRSIVKVLVPGHSERGEQANLGPGDPLKRFRKHFAATVRRFNRPVLVIIEDVDRAKHEAVVGLIRGLHTILKSRRVIYLIVGDRQWIERSFEVCHEEMNGLDDGSEHTLGSRFVEKAVQLSYVLPSMSDETHDKFVREILLGPEPETADDRTGAYRAKIRADLSHTENVEQAGKRGRALEDAAEAEGDEAGVQVIREELVLHRATNREQTDAAIVRHCLDPLIPYLPRNPREIKRIINAIAMYQDSLLLLEGERAGIGTERWQKLVIGVVLMMRFPETWARLVADPQLVNIINTAEGADEFDEVAEVPNQNDRRGFHPHVAELLSNTKFSSKGEEVATIINAETVRWLHRLIPVAGLRAVDKGEQNAFHD